MINNIKMLFLATAIMSLICVACSVPQRVLPQEDMPASELNDPALATKVLIASRYSEFKDAVIDTLKKSFADQPVYIKVIGLEDLKNENPDQYNAIVMINKCMGWNLDRNVVHFLDDNKDYSNVIVFTTSGDGNWEPKKDARNFDTISSASKMPRVDAVANQLIEKVNLLIRE